jgi:hypothetical protein
MCRAHTAARSAGINPQRTEIHTAGGSKIVVIAGSGAGAAAAASLSIESEASWQ